GNVAYNLCRHLHEEGENLIVTDINKHSVQRAVSDFGARAVDPEEIYSQDCYIYATCALGATINDGTIKQLNAKVIAGAANYQLKETRHGDQIQVLGFVYAPD
ncbi:branched-chain amino acid dehydrogenase, partial [Bacillus vallismortis]|nr:branched-chain amino acid dehydrogenase [Bacillus vallismortis]